MSKPYEGRHRAAHSDGRPGRHGVPGKPKGVAVAKAVGRPALTAGFALAVVATTAAGYQAKGGRDAGHAGYTVSSEAVEQANELANTQIENDARLASARNQANVSAAAAQEKNRRDAAVAAAAAAKARQETAAQAARAAERAALAKKRQAVLARAQEDPKAVARLLMADYGWGDGQFGCLDHLWIGESNWNFKATNSSSGAYGIAQALPASKMASAGADWRDNPATQIKWGLGYIKSSYGSPCNAWAFWQSNSPHWY
jgi:hypothetical protein